MLCRRPARPARCQLEAIVPGIAGHHHGIERADIDAELQRVGGDYRADLAVAELALDLAPLLRQITAAIAAHRLARQRPAIAGVLQIRHQHFRREAIVGEDQRLQVALDEFQRQAPRLVDVAAADSELPVHHRRIVEDEELLAARRAVALDQLERRLRSAPPPVRADWRWWPSSR